MIDPTLLQIWSVFLAKVSVINFFDGSLIASVILLNMAVIRLGMWPYCLVTIPGTATHEVTHWLVAKIFWARPEFPSLWPKKQAEGWLMGSVRFVPSFINSIPVALAPLLLVPVGLLFTAIVMHPASGWMYALDGWVAGNMLHACLPSRQDWRIAAPALSVIAIGTILIWVFLHYFWH